MKGKKAEYCVTYLNPGAVETQAGRFLLSLKPAWSTQSSGQGALQREIMPHKQVN